MIFGIAGTKPFSQMERRGGERPERPERVSRVKGMELGFIGR
jgi:hypothetical protein